MNSKLLYGFVILLFNIVASQDDFDDFFKHTHSDEYYDPTFSEEVNNEKDLRTDKPKHGIKDVSHDLTTKIGDKYNFTLSNEEKLTTNAIEATERPISRYEVTEDIEDIPDTETVLRPITTNFTVKIPHNNATVVANTGNTTAEEDDKIDEPHKFIENSFSSFHIKTEYDKQHQLLQNINIHNANNVIAGLKDYIRGFKKGIAHGLNSFKEVHNGHTARSGAKLANAVIVPVLFINKVHRTSSDVVTNVHKSILGFGPRDDY